MTLLKLVLASAILLVWIAAIAWAVRYERRKP
jgi:hypothetical protein